MIGTLIRADAVLYVDSVDYVNKYCKLIQKMTLNPDDTKEVIFQFLKQLGLKNKEYKKLRKTAVFEINSYNTYEYYYYPGIFLH